jgi:hypothetical protein
MRPFLASHGIAYWFGVGLAGLIVAVVAGALVTIAYYATRRPRLPIKASLTNRSIWLIGVGVGVVFIIVRAVEGAFA